MSKRFTIFLVLIAATLLLYLQCGRHDFIILDDQLYVSKNPSIAGGLTADSVKWAFSLGSTETSGNWHPVTWLSHILDVQLFGLNPAGHHLVNVFWHALDVGLLFLFLSAVTGALWPSALVAAIFAFHPLHVESVAWVAERKDVLSTFFWMAALLIYAGYVRKRSAGRYAALLAVFVIGLMSKPMLVSLPIVLLLLDYWPLGRFATAGGPAPLVEGGTQAADREGRVLWPLLLEKLPLAGITAFFCGLAIYAQRQGGAVADLSVLPISLRVYNALLAYLAYIGKTVWPVNLAVYYPFPRVESYLPAVGCLVLLVAISLVAVLNARRRPYLAVGWFWFVITLLPVIGLVQVGHQSMADRYMYIPMVGLAIIAVWGIPEILPSSLRQARILAPVAGAVLLVFAALTWNQLGYWQNSRSLLTHTLKVTGENYYAHILFGNWLFQEGNYNEALPHYLEAVRIHPRNEVAHYKIGMISMITGDLNQAIQHLVIALQLKPDSERSANARASLERCLAIKGQMTPR
ncbi:hypothetical protein GMSM_06930 [Geomonas sp. Red276]